MDKERKLRCGLIGLARTTETTQAKARHTYQSKGGYCLKKPHENLSCLKTATNKDLVRCENNFQNARDLVMCEKQLPKAPENLSCVKTTTNREIVMCENHHQQGPRYV